MKKEKNRKNKEWLAWRKAKKEARLTEHRRVLRSYIYRQAKKAEHSKEDKER